MADNLNVPGGSAGPVATDEIGGVHYQRVKVQYGTDGNATDVSDTNPMPVDDAGGSLTVDNSTLSVVGGGTQATALRVTVASDSTGVLSVDDNAGSLTVDSTQLPSSLGQKTSAASLSIVPASDYVNLIASNTNTKFIDGATVAATNTGGAYAAGHLVGTKLTLSGISTDKDARLLSFSVNIAGISSGTSFDFDAIFFASDPSSTTFTDKTAFAVSTTDAEKVTGILKITNTNFSTVGGIYGTIATDVVIRTGSGTSYAALVARSAFRPANDNDISLTFGFLGD